VAQYKKNKTYVRIYILYGASKVPKSVISKLQQSAKKYFGKKFVASAKILFEGILKV